MESANIVGYTQNALGDVANSQIVCFDGIAAGGEIDIQSIVPTVADPTTPLESYQASIMTLTPGMGTDALSRRGSERQRARRVLGSCDFARGITESR